MKIKDFKLEDYMEGYKFVVTIPEGTKYIEKHRKKRTNSGIFMRTQILKGKKCS